jgi:hypothetical protein
MRWLAGFTVAMAWLTLVGIGAAKLVALHNPAGAKLSISVAHQTITGR